MSKRRIYLSICLLVFVALFFAKGALSLDPDFRYRLRTGQNRLSGNIPKVDPYSYTMPSFPYVEHAPAIASFWALLFPRIGHTGIAFIHALFAVLALVISTRRTLFSIPKMFPANDTIFGRKINILGWFPFLLAFTVMLPYSGVRAQVISWVLIAVFLHLVLKKQIWDKYKFVTPVFFLLWANIHGSWSAALAILFATTAFRSYQSKKILFTDIAISILSLGATLINPYGTGLWREVWLSLSDSQIRWRISEWMPPFISVDFGLIFFFTVSVFLVYKYRKLLDSNSVFIYALVLIQAMLSRRHIPLWILVALPITVDSLALLYDDIKDIKFGKERFQKIYSITWVISLVMMFILSGLTLKNSTKLSEENYYPKGAVEYLQENDVNPDSKMFATYGWGGYLLWKYPEEKVFVDGRMPSWRWDAPENELDAAFDTYTDIFNGDEDYGTVFEEYNINRVLISPPKKGDQQENPIEKWYKSLRAKLGKEVNDFNIHDSLTENGWEIIYQDDVSALYEKQN